MTALPPSTDPHGSYVVSLVAGPNVGVVPEARVFHAAAVETVGQETYASATSIATAIDWLMSQRVEVINMSLAGPDNPLLYRAIRIAAARGTILVAPVGNGGPGGGNRLSRRLSGSGGDHRDRPAEPGMATFVAGGSARHRGTGRGSPPRPGHGQRDILRQPAGRWCPADGARRQGDDR